MSVECLVIEPAIDVFDFEPYAAEKLLNLRGGRIPQRHTFHRAIRTALLTDNLECDFEVEHLLPLVPDNGSSESGDSPTVCKRDLAVVRSPVRGAEFVKAARAATRDVKCEPSASREVPKNGAET